MADTTTTTYGLTKPEVGASDDTWGTKLNTDLDLLDDLLDGTTAIAPNLSTLKIAGTVVTSTATELNLLDGVTATTVEINYISGVTSSIQTQFNALGTTSNVRHGSLGIGTAASGTTGEIRATNNVTAYYSDNRLKTRLGPIEDALAKINTLSGFYYEANEIAQALGYTVKKEVGVSAQEVQAVLPEIVVPAPIDDKYLTVHYEKMVPLLIEAIKELAAKVEILENS
jgi:hypothetical protein